MEGIGSSYFPPSCVLGGAPRRDLASGMDDTLALRYNGPVLAFGPLHTSTRLNSSRRTQEQLPRYMCDHDQACLIDLAASKFLPEMAKPMVQLSKLVGRCYTRMACKCKCATQWLMQTIGHVRN